LALEESVLPPAFVSITKGRLCYLRSDKASNELGSALLEEANTPVKSKAIAGTFFIFKIKENMSSRTY
jgi:hypothetical protein